MQALVREPAASEKQTLVAEPALSGDQTLVAKPDSRGGNAFGRLSPLHSASPLHFFHLQRALFSELLLLL